MSKRLLQEGELQEPAKKPKTAPETSVTSARQLQQMLAFQQDAIPQLRTALKAFKSFLESIVYVEDKAASKKQQSLLKEYLDAQVLTRPGAVFLSDLVQAWGFAAQTNNDGLLSAMTAILALLLKTISGLIDFKDLASALITTVLDQDQLKILSRSLSAPKHKEHIISPALRLLTEAVSFDGGSQARKVFTARSSTFDPKIIARDLSLGPIGAETRTLSHDQPSVRSNSVLYLLANLRFQPPSAKIEILKQSMVFKALFDNIRYDSADIITHVLITMRESVIKDSSVPRKVKGYLFTPHNLSSIAGIYRQDRDTKGLSQSVVTVAHDFLTFICTDSLAGILRPSSGLYPPGTIKSDPDGPMEDNDARTDLGLESIEWYGSFTSQVPVRNGVLSSFIQQLKPYSFEKERDLLLAIFRFAPELVADYFFRSSFAFDPKLTATWIGYATFLFSMLQQPLPPNLGQGDEQASIPPPTSIVVESILPRPLNSKVLTRCLNQQSPLVTYFAIRILVLALEKLRKYLEVFSKQEAVRGALWGEVASRLKDEFAVRCPKLKDIIGAFRKMPEEGRLQRETALRLITLYHVVTPQLAAEEQFDVSLTLDKSLDEFERSNGTARDSFRLQSLELSHLLRITRMISGTRWWHKPESLRYSPFVCILKIVAMDSEPNSLDDMKALLTSVVIENDMLQSETTRPGLEALLASLKPAEGWRASEKLFSWLDEVLGRFTKRPIKYLDDLDSLMEERGPEPSPSPVWMALVEQLPFALSRSDSSEEIVQWLGRLSNLAKIIGENAVVMEKIRGLLRNAQGMTKDFRNAFDLATEENLQGLLSKAAPSTALVGGEEETRKPLGDRSDIDARHFAPPSEEDFSSQDLHRAVSMDISDAISTGALGSLMLCLSSTDPDIRAQALMNLHIILKRVSTSQAQDAYPQGKQMYLLLGVLCNTASRELNAAKLRNSTKASDDEQAEDDEDGNLPVPYVVTVFASMAAAVLSEPTHPLYSKINQFLLRGPSWDPARLPSYWVHALLRTPPTDTVIAQAASAGAPAAPPALITAATARFDRAVHPLKTLPAAPPFPHSPQHAAAHFLASYVYHALRSPTDLALLRRRSTFEPLLALAGDAFMPPALVDIVIATVWRAAAVRGGSGTLITRAGVFAWLGGLLADKGARGAGLKADREIKALVRRLWVTCDQQRVEKWAGGTMEVLVAQLLRS